MTWVLERRSSLCVKRNNQQLYHQEFQQFQQQLQPPRGNGNGYAKRLHQRRHSVSACAANCMGLAAANYAAVLTATQECKKSSRMTTPRLAPFQAFSGLFEPNAAKNCNKSSKRSKFAQALGVSTTASSDAAKSAATTSVKSPQQKLCLQQQKSPQKILQSTTVAPQIFGPVTTTSSARELPVIRSHYSAHDVKVFIGKKFLLNHFETSQLVLRTGIQPKLCVVSTTTSKSEKIQIWDQPKTIALPLDTKCEIKHRNQVKLSAKTLSCRVYLKFTMVADAFIWLKLIQEALRLAFFLTQMKPKPWTTPVHHGDPRRSTRSCLAGKPNLLLYEHVMSQKQLVVKVLPGQRVDTSREIAALKRLFAKTQGIVDHYAVFETPQDVRVIMPLYQGMTLLDMISVKRQLPEPQAKRIMRRICHQLTMLHAAGVVHCDLKLENFVVTHATTGTDDCVQLIDFGGAFLVDQHDTTPSNKCTSQDTNSQVLIGTPGYISPGRLRGANPTPRSDVFAMGIILYQMITASHPFPATSTPLAVDVTKTLDLKSIKSQLAGFGVSLGAQNLIVSMLEPAADKRISLADIMNHVWMQ